MVHTFCNHKRVSLKYGPEAPPINIVTDASYTRIAGVISQGEDWHKADVAVFFSAKLNMAQQNYPVHEQEILAGLETILRYRHLLQGVRFWWYTDHKRLTHLFTQGELRSRRAQWIEQLAEFNFEIIHVPGVENVLSDALSQIYADDTPGTERSPREYPQFDDENLPPRPSGSSNALTRPVVVGLEALAVGMSQRLEEDVSIQWCSTRSRKPTWKVKEGAVLPSESDSDEPVAVPSKQSHADTEDKASLFAKCMAKRPFRMMGPQEPPGRSRVTEPTDQPEGGSTNTTANADTESNIRNTNADAESNVRTNTESGNNGESKEDGYVKDLSRHYENVHDADIIAKVTSLVSLLNEKILGVNLIDVIRLNYLKDPTFAKILEAPTSHKNFVVQNELIYLKEEGDQEVLGIPDHVVIDGRNLCEIIISEAHSLLAHLGTSKTCAYLRDHVWWKSINQDV